MQLNKGRRAPFWVAVAAIAGLTATLALAAAAGRVGPRPTLGAIGAPAADTGGLSAVPIVEPRVQAAIEPNEVGAPPVRTTLARLGVMRAESTVGEVPDAASRSLPDAPDREVTALPATEDAHTELRGDAPATPSADEPAETSRDTRPRRRAPRTATRDRDSDLAAPAIADADEALARTGAGEPVGLADNDEVVAVTDHDTIVVEITVATLPDDPEVGGSQTTEVVTLSRRDDPWAPVRQCESGGDYTINTGNGFYGAYQFTISTWNWVAEMIGRDDLVGVRPHRAAPQAQDLMANALAFEVPGGGLHHWPVCGRRYGT